jgi:hypothetical protein
MNVTTLYADMARSKSLWAHRRVNDPLSAKLMSTGIAAADKMATTQSRDLYEVLLKLAELQDILMEDATPAQAALVSSLIEDVEGMLGGAPSSEPPKASPATPRVTLQRNPKAAVDRRCRAAVIDGVMYRSIAEASRATGIPRRMISDPKAH